MSNQLRRTVLYSFHLRHKARMGDFAGYDMPMHYPGGALQEHHHTRQATSLFDLSHVGQVEFHGADRERFLEWLTPCDVRGLAEGQASLTLMLNERGGVKDDFILSKSPTHLLAVLNAGCKAKDMAYFRAKAAEFDGDVSFVEQERAVLALQGPKSAEVLRRHTSDIDALKFMRFRSGVRVGAFDAHVTRAGYSGEDGFELVVPSAEGEALAEFLLRDATLQLAGLAARDSLRLEAGNNLYAHELSEDIDMVAARMTWCVSKRRMAEGGFVGHAQLKELRAREAQLVPRVRVGILSARGPIARRGTRVLVDGAVVGEITSGVASPTLGRNIAMAYVDRNVAGKGQRVELDVRGKRVAGEIAQPRFVSPRYHRG